MKKLLVILLVLLFAVNVLYANTMKADKLLTGLITSTSADGNIAITPHGTGNIILDSHWNFNANALTSLTENNTTLTAYAGKNITVESVTFDGGVVGSVTTLTMNSTLTNSSLNTVGGIVQTDGSGVFSTSVDIPTATTIGTKYVYRVDGTDVAVADGGLALSTIGQGEILYASGADAYSALAVNSTGTNKFLRQVSSGAPSWSILETGDIPDISGTYQPLDAALTNISALVFATESFIKLTADDTYTVRTIAQTKVDLSLDNVTNVATDGTAYNESSWDANTDASTKNAIRDKIETMDTAIAANTARESTVADASLTANEEKTNIITSGYKLNTIVIMNNGAGGVTLNIGTSDSGVDVMLDESIGAGELLTYNVGEMYALATAKSLWFHALDWTNVDLEVYVMIEKVK